MIEVTGKLIFIISRPSLQVPKRSAIKEIHFCVIFLTKKFVLSIIIRIFAESVLAKPLNNAQIVRGVFCLYTFEYSESYSGTVDF